MMMTMVSTMLAVCIAGYVVLLLSGETSRGGSGLAKLPYKEAAMGKVKRGAATVDLTHLVEVVLAQLTVMYEVLEYADDKPFLDSPSRYAAIDSLERVGSMCQQTAQDFRGADEW